MLKINLVRGIALLFILFFFVGIVISYIFNVDFVEKNIDDDGRVGEHTKIRINIFQNQMFYLNNI